MSMLGLKIKRVLIIIKNISPRKLINEPQMRF